MLICWLCKYWLLNNHVHDHHNNLDKTNLAFASQIVSPPSTFEMFSCCTMATLHLPLLDQPKMNDKILEQASNYNIVLDQRMQYTITERNGGSWQKPANKKPKPFEQCELHNSNVYTFRVVFTPIVLIARFCTMSVC